MVAIVLARSRTVLLGSRAFAVLLTLATVAGCGGTSPGSQAGDAAEAQAINGARTASNQYAAVKLTEPVTTVGRLPITRAMLQRTMEVGIKGRQEVPEPPKYTACVTRLRTSQEFSGEGQALLRAECQRRYEALMTPALTNLIDQLWVAGEAAEMNIEINEAEVEHALARQIGGRTFSRASQQSGETLSEMRRRQDYNQLTERIYRAVDTTAPKATSFQLERYYREHKARFFHHQEERDLHIVRTRSKAEAAKVLDQLESGRSFASIVEHVPISQPIDAFNGLFLGLTPGRFVELPLAHAIFRAHPGEIVGPVRIPYGYYVFEVTKIHAPHQATLAEAEPGLRKELPTLLRSEHLASFVTAFRKKWTARTDCRDGFVVEDCRQFKGTVAAEKNHEL
ncbi:MAG TPA: peptidylprolyl isomerase [Solirubrobacteraceae bacterium]|jgi:foldase protein PrsA|nr:peptidylprolyl isomerase [Solirubrobacteraceae bacterium]